MLSQQGIVISTVDGLRRPRGWVIHVHVDFEDEVMIVCVGCWAVVCSEMSGIHATVDEEGRSRAIDLIRHHTGMITFFIRAMLLEKRAKS